MCAKKKCAPVETRRSCQCQARVAKHGPFVRANEMCWIVLPRLLCCCRVPMPLLGLAIHASDPTHQLGSMHPVS